MLDRDLTPRCLVGAEVFAVSASLSICSTDWSSFELGCSAQRRQTSLYSEKKLMVWVRPSYSSLSWNRLIGPIGVTTSCSEVTASSV
jgi:hypothetical protein